MYILHISPVEQPYKKLQLNIICNDKKRNRTIFENYLK